MNNNYYIYILASGSGTLYIGVTNDLRRRFFEHQQDNVGVFSKQYHCNKLVYFEEYQEAVQAIAREKQLKKWRREKKELLIIKLNPGWRDLSNDY